MAKPRRGVGPTLVLDADGLSKLSAGDPAARALFLKSREQRSEVVTAATTLTEVLRGDARDALVHMVLKHITVVDLSEPTGRRAGELLGRVGLSGHRYALDALLAVVAMAQSRPVVLLTSDPQDMARLTEEPGVRKRDQVTVVHT
jgi:predicted nucleic acid-binding protein